MNFDVLIVDDEVELGNATKEYLEAFGVTADFVSSSKGALDWLDTNMAELLLLDINLKDGSGFDLCKSIRKQYNMPIFFISARIKSDDILLALNIGGDDYITKPYELSILLAKIKSRLARIAGSRDSLRSHDLHLDLTTRKAFKSGVDLELKNKEFLLLSYLIQNKNKTLTKDEIFSTVWGDAFFSEGTLAVHVRRLRERIEQDPDCPQLIRTVWGVGYVFSEGA